MSADYNAPNSESSTRVVSSGNKSFRENEIKYLPTRGLGFNFKIKSQRLNITKTPNCKPSRGINPPQLNTRVVATVNNKLRETVNKTTLDAPPCSYCTKTRLQ